MKYIGPRDNPATVENPHPPYVNGNRQTGIKGSKVDGEVLSAIQLEIEKVIVEAGLTPDGNDLTQLWQAILASSGRIGLAEAGGTATAITVTTAPPTGALEGGMISIFALSNDLDLSVATTLDLDGHGARPLRDLDGEATGTAPAGRAVIAWYNGVHWRIMAGLDGYVLPDPGGVTPPVSYPNKQVFSYTGADQTLDLSALAWTEATAANRFVKFKIWGGSGSKWLDRIGGAGAFVEGEIRLDGSVSINGSAIDSTSSLALIVGQAGGVIWSPDGGYPYQTENSYGFGGKGACDGLGSNASGGSAGGGLSGVFVGSAAVTKTDAARALAVAGGGSGHSETGSVVGALAKSGGEPIAGGELTMQGIDKVPVTNSDNGFGGGGGGYTGGTAANTGAAQPAGGECYVNPAVLNPVMMNAVGGAVAAPNNGDVDYVAGVAVSQDTSPIYDGQTHYPANGNGLIVVEWN